MLAVYGKHKNGKRFYGFNFSKGTFEINKIYVTMFPENQREKLEEEVNFMNKHNKEYIFEIREV